MFMCMQLLHDTIRIEAPLQLVDTSFVIFSLAYVCIFCHFSLAYVCMYVCIYTCMHVYIKVETGSSHPHQPGHVCLSQVHRSDPLYKIIGSEPDTPLDHVC